MKAALRPWIFGVLASAVGLVGILALGMRDARLDPAAAYDSPGFWLWVTSPCLAWALANYVTRVRFYPSLVMALGALIGQGGGLALVWHDAFRSRTPGGMNPFSSSNIVFTLMLVAFANWVLLVLALVVAGVLWWRCSSAVEIVAEREPPI